MNAPATGLAARERAHTVLHEVLDRGRPLDEVLHTDLRLAKLNERDRAFVRNLVATTLRRLGQIDAMLDDCLDRPLPRSAAAARNALRIGACQILFLDVQTHAAVDTSVALCAHRGPDRFKGLVNAILRRIARETPESLESKYPPALNLPAWLRECWTEAYGAEETSAILAACLAVPPVDLTVKSDPAGWAARLGGIPIAGNTIRLERATGIATLPGFAEGDWWVQDAAAALPAQILMSALSGAMPADVCDICAAPGGKTAQLAAAGLGVTAVDVSAPRLRTVRENLRRLGLAAALVEADATVWLPETPFAGALLDAPCTATGTIRRHPDILHAKRPSDVGRQAAIQKKLLDRAAHTVGPGGTLVYSVCSLQPDEGSFQVDGFLSRHGDFRRAPVRADEIPGFENCLTAEGDVVTLPGRLAQPGGMDGFYIARLQRREDA
ncbi:MAG: transcription antitermination factor NusB [Rhodospirillaceae bacterium]